MPDVPTLESAGLAVKILDPARDAARLGSRYCTGGYVWQVTDVRAGELLSGPCFPDPEPPPFHGQGLPEVFETALGADSAEVGDDVWVIGVGRVRRESSIEPFHVRDNPTVVERTAWGVESDARSVVMRSHEAFAGFELELSRSVSLEGRTLTSSTALANVGARAIPLRWFAHPFFPWASGECFRASPALSLPGNPGFLVNGDGFVERRKEHAWERGCFVVPDAELGRELSVTVKHPALTEVRVTCRFPLARLALWGNDRTVSFEPFHQLSLAPGATSEWSLEYRF